MSMQLNPLNYNEPTVVVLKLCSCAKTFYIAQHVRGGIYLFNFIKNTQLSIIRTCSC